MPAEKNNQYWKLRSKHGRDRIIKDPESLLESANEYFQWCIDNPVLQTDFKSTKNGLEEIQIPHPQVFQKGALARYCHLSEWRLLEDLKKVSEDFSQIVTHIEGIIRDQKFKYASVGMFNSNIIARDLGLADKRENKNEDVKPDLSTLSEDEILMLSKLQSKIKKPE